MTKYILPLLIFLSCKTIIAQPPADTITAADAEKHISYLASGKMGGRVNFTRKQLKAARYIAAEFSACGLLPYPEYTNYYQPFFHEDSGQLAPFRATDTLLRKMLYNVVGILPGKSKADEFIVFSAHYDHVDHGLYGNGGTFNGANDNASGTAAVLMLARYYALRADNERTLVFCLFAGEELGLLGSKAFVRQVNVPAVKAVINIEMIGRYNRAGPNGFFITGSGYSNLEEILIRNLKHSPVKPVSEGPDLTNLYARSDNYSFAGLGIPAHSIMCSDDKDACYHQTCDIPAAIDYKNMAAVVKAIAQGVGTLVSGREGVESK